MTNKIHNGDWRLQGQEKYLKGAKLFFKKYKAPRPNWEHDHCEFCSRKFMKKQSAEMLQEGYTTKDEYRWICKDCYEDFKERFDWQIG